jgi:hypothetical protein
MSSVNPKQSLAKAAEATTSSTLSAAAGALIFTPFASLIGYSAVRVIAASQPCAPRGSNVKSTVARTIDSMCQPSRKPALSSSP